MSSRRVLWKCPWNQPEPPRKAAGKSFSEIICPWRIHGAAIYGVPWIPSIYPSHVSIFLPAPAGSVMGWVKLSSHQWPSGNPWLAGTSVRWCSQLGLQAMTDHSSSVGATLRFPSEKWVFQMEWPPFAMDYPRGNRYWISNIDGQLQHHFGQIHNSCIHIHMICVNYNNLTATSLESWLIRGIIPEWP